MGRAAVGAGLASVAAAGAVLIGVRSPAAAPLVEARAARVDCSPGSRPARAVQKTDTLMVRGRATLDAIVWEGDWVRTDDEGTAKLCLNKGSTTCTMGNGNTVHVQPPKRKDVLLYLAKADAPLSCETSSGGTKWFETPGTRIRVDDPVFSLTAGALRTIVKVRRGALIVGKRNDMSRAVVLGRGEQVVVPTGRDPQRPTRINLTPVEHAVFAEVESWLPSELPGDVPTARVRGPGDPSSLRSATFTFGANHAGSVFSCALETQVFRICTSPWRFASVAPGRHRFWVKATNRAGFSDVASHSWTVDGSLIAFTSDRDETQEIFTLAPDGRDRRQLTSNRAVDAEPAWSRDQSKIAFYSERAGNPEIYVMNRDGSGVVRVTENPATDRNPAWSPDGERIVFESNRDGNWELYAVHADGTSEVRLTETQADERDAAWSKDNRIAFTSDRDRNPELYVMNADGTRVMRLTVDPDAIDGHPSWSPDGTRLAFDSKQVGKSSNIYVINVDGSNVVRLTETFLEPRWGDDNPAWSPDGEEIVFASSRDSVADPGPTMELYRMHADGSEETRLTKRPRGNDFVPSW